MIEPRRGCCIHRESLILSNLAAWRKRLPVCWFACGNNPRFSNTVGRCLAGCAAWPCVGQQLGQMHGQAHSWPAMTQPQGDCPDPVGLVGFSWEVVQSVVHGMDLSSNLLIAPSAQLGVLVVEPWGDGVVPSNPELPTMRALISWVSEVRFSFQRIVDIKNVDLSSSTCSWRQEVVSVILFFSWMVGCLTSSLIQHSFEMANSSSSSFNATAEMVPA